MLTLDTPYAPWQSAEIVDLTGQGCEFRLGADEEVHLPIGSSLMVHLEFEGTRSLQRTAVVRERSESDKQRRYILRFHQTADELEELVGLVERQKEARRAVRVTADMRRPILVRLEPVYGGGRARGTVVNISTSGVAVRAHRSAEELLARESSLVVYLNVPGEETPAVFEASVVGRQLEDGAVIYRLQFTREVRTSTSSSAETLLNYIVARQRAQRNSGT